MWLFLPISDWSYTLVAQAQGKVPLKKELSEALFQEPGKEIHRTQEKRASFREKETASCGVLASLYLKQEGH